MRLVRLLLMLSVLVTASTILMIAFRLFVIALPLALYLARRNKSPPLSAHGTARLADSDDLEAAGMLGDKGLAIGRVLVKRPRLGPAVRGLFSRKVPAREACERFLEAIRKGRPITATARLAKAVHLMLVAPVGAGKSKSLIVPFLLESRDSCVVLDPKGELARLTADARRAMGHKVVVLDPWRMVTNEPDRFNPLAHVNWESPLVLDELRSIADEIVVRSGDERDPHWNDRAMQVVFALAAYLCLHEPALRNLQSVRDLATNEAMRDEAIEKMMASDVWGRMLKRAGQSVAGLEAEERASVYSHVQRHTSFLDTVPVAESTRSSTFDPAELKSGNATVYMVLPPEHLRAQAALLRLWVGSLLRSVVKAGLGEEKKVHFVLDEAASLGRLDVLEDAVAQYRGYGVRLIFAYQSLGQLKRCWREGADRTLMANTSHVYFAIRDFETAEEVSKTLGQSTVVTEDWNTNKGGSRSANTADHGGSIGESWGRGRGYHQTGKPLARPEELLVLDQHTAITFTPGVPPILSHLVPYYVESAAPSRWKRFKANAELLMVAVCLLGCTTMVGAWLWALLTPVRR